MKTLWLMVNLIDVTQFKEIVFDVKSKSILHTEMAKNPFVKRGIVVDLSAYDQSKHLRTSGDYTHMGYSSPSLFHSPSASVWGPHGYMAPTPSPPSSSLFALVRRNEDVLGCNIVL